MLRPGWSSPRAVRSTYRYTLATTSGRHDDTVAQGVSYLYDQYAAVQSGPPGGSPTQSFLMLPSDEVTAVSTTSNGVTTTAVPLHDILGSTIGLVNAAGSVATSYAYEPFGNPTMSGAASAFPYLFAGMEYDASSGLYHTPARYYSPNMGRWLSEDPLQFGAGDLNLLAYAANDPVSNIDPSGAEFAAFGYCAYGFAGDVAELASKAGVNQAAASNGGSDDGDNGSRLPAVGNIADYLGQQGISPEQATAAFGFGTGQGSLGADGTVSVSGLIGPAGGIAQSPRRSVPPRLFNAQFPGGVVSQNPTAPPTQKPPEMRKMPAQPPLPCPGGNLGVISELDLVEAATVGGCSRRCLYWRALGVVWPVA